MTEPRPGGGQDVTNYYYNPVGKLIRVEMPRDGVTQVRKFIYDPATQRLDSATNPETGLVTYAYNADGTLKSKTDFKGFRTEYTYDDKQRVTVVKVFNAQNQEQECERKSFAYDVADGYTQNGVGRVGNETWTGCQGGSFTQRYSYTPAGLKTKKRLEGTGLRAVGTQQPLSDLSMEGTYQYDNEGRMTAQTYPGSDPSLPSNLTYFYSYDAMGRQSQMTRQLCTVWNAPEPGYWSVCNNPVVASATYGVAGEVLSLSYFGTTETRQYNARLQMTRQTVAGVMDIEYRYSATANNGRITSQKDNVSGEEVVYQYDELSRLIQAASAGWTQNYTYDGFGNKLTHTGMASLTYDGATNRINTMHGWQYDASGNATVMPWATLSYDGYNRVKQANTSSGTEYYEYSPDNKRIAKWTGTAWEFYFYNVRGERVETARNASSIEGERAYFLGRLIRVEENTIVTDRLGSVRRNGATSLRCYPYGEEQAVTASETEKYGTYFRDQKTNLDYADQRYYASGFGRFLTPDPYKASAGLADPGSWNRYSYVQGDPVNYNDPSGLLEANVTDGNGCMEDPTGFFWTQYAGNPCPPGMIPATGVSSVSPLQRLFEVVDSLRHEGATVLPTDEYGTALSVKIPLDAFALGFLPQLAGAGAAGGIVLIGGGPITWTVAAGGAVVLTGVALWQSGVLQKILDQVKAYGKRPAVTDEVRKECEEYAHANADNSGKPRYKEDWMKDYSECLRYGGVLNMPH